MFGYSFYTVFVYKQVNKRGAVGISVTYKPKKYLRISGFGWFLLRCLSCFIFQTYYHSIIICAKSLFHRYVYWVMDSFFYLSPFSHPSIISHFLYLCYMLYNKCLQVYQSDNSDFLITPEVL